MEYTFLVIIIAAILRVLYVDVRGPRYRITEKADRFEKKFYVEVQGAFMWHKCGLDGKAVYGHKKPILQLASLTEARSRVRTFKSRTTTHHSSDEL